MAWKLSAEESKNGDALTERFDKVTHAITDKSEPPTADEIKAYNSVVEDITEHVNNVAERIRGEFDEKSERWQISETGESVQDWVETWENHSTDELAEDDDMTNEGARAELITALEDFNSLPSYAEL